jgi:hypothetical protein
MEKIILKRPVFLVVFALSTIGIGAAFLVIKVLAAAVSSAFGFSVPDAVLYIIALYVTLMCLYWPRRHELL